MPSFPRAGDRRGSKIRTSFRLLANRCSVTPLKRRCDLAWSAGWLFLRTSEGILAVGAALGAETLLRPSEFATDLASTDDAIAHFIAALQIAPETLIVLLQPTSPLRNAAHIADAVALWREKQPACLVSVFEPIEHPAKSFRLDQDGTLTGMFSADAPFQPRQILPKAFMPNGAIYVFSAGAFLASGTIPRKGLLPFFMDRNSSLDIDCLEDLAVAERYLQKSSHD